MGGGWIQSEPETREEGPASGVRNRWNLTMTSVASLDLAQAS